MNAVHVPDAACAGAVADVASASAIESKGDMITATPRADARRRPMLGPQEHSEGIERRPTAKQTRLASQSSGGCDELLFVRVRAG